MKNLFSIFVIILFSSSIFAQNNQPLGDFHFIDVFDKIPVQLKKSDTNSIEITGSRAEEVELVAKNGELKIRMTTKNFLQGDEVNVVLHYTTLDEIHANEGSQITSDQTLTAEKLLLNAKEGAEISLPIEVGNLEIKTNSGGKIKVSGNAEFQNVVSNSGGNYDGEKLNTKITNVTVNAGGEAKINAQENVDAKTRAGGNIYIFGEAQVKQETIAGGKIHVQQ